MGPWSHQGCDTDCGLGTVCGSITAASAAAAMGGGGPQGHTGGLG